MFTRSPTVESNRYTRELDNCKPAMAVREFVFVLLFAQFALSSE